MRVLLVNHFPLTGSGSGVYTANLAKSLSRKGLEVAIVFPDNRKNYETYENIKLFPIFFSNTEKIPGQLPMNFPCFTTHPRSTFNFKDMTDEQKKEYEHAFENKINEVIQSFSPDVVHAQHVWTLAGISAKCCEKHNIPLIVTCHGTDLMGILDEKSNNISWGTSWANYAIQYANTIITISKDSHEQVKELFPNVNSKLLWIRNGVDNHVFFKDDTIKKVDVLRSFGIETNYKYVVSFVGKLTNFKGVDILLSAAAQYETEDIVTIIAGDGELKEPLLNQAKELHLKNVIFLGNQPQNKLNELYNIADCSCVPSRREPFGLVAAEALICGTPVIATNEGGLPDFVKEDVGILVEPENPTSLANAVKDIINKKVVFDSNHISKKIQNNYSQDVLIDKFIEIYNKSI